MQSIARCFAQQIEAARAERGHHQAGAPNVEDRIRKADGRGQETSGFGRGNADFGHKAHGMQLNRNTHWRLDDVPVLTTECYARPAEQARCDVVGMAFQTRRDVEYSCFVQRIAVVLIRQQHTADNCGCATAEAATEHNAVGALESKAGVGCARGIAGGASGTQDQVVGVVALSMHGRRRDLVPQIQRKPETIEARSEVGARGGRAYNDPRHVPEAAQCGVKLVVQDNC